MRNLILAASILSALPLASCASAATGDSVAVGEAIELSADSPFTAVVYGTFNEPWALDFEPGTGNVFITEKSGSIKFYQPANGRLGTVTEGLPEVAYGGQGGLGDIVFAPDYESSGIVYLSWAKGEPGTASRAAVGRGKLVCEEDDSCRIEGLSEIWQQSRDGARTGHYSHRIAFSPDGRYLFVSSGDRQEMAPAQDLSNNLGTVVRLNLDGTPAAGNPFAGRESPSDQIWSYGHRNLLGLAFDADGQLWDIEHGPAGGDELNRVDEGANYGWPERSYGDHYNGDPIPDHRADDGFAKPALSWNPVIAPGGMTFYSGEMFAEWQGQLLVANLATTSIVRIKTDAAANSATEEARYTFPNRLRDIAEAPDGAIWVIEDKQGGRLLRLTPADR